MRFRLRGMKLNQLTQVIRNIFCFAVFVGFYFFLLLKILFLVFLFFDNVVAISFAIGGVNRKLKKHYKKQKHKKQNFQEQEKNKSDQN